MKIIRIILPLLLGITQIGFSQWIVYNPYNTKGIEGTMVSSGFVAKDDKLWFGTDQGVASFDPEYSIGSKATLFTRYSKIRRATYGLLPMAEE
jgi:hypothetical protein